MSIEAKMTIDEKRKYLHKMQKRYRAAKRKEKGRLLDEMEQVTELHRKHLITLLKGDLKRKKRQKQRSSTYGVDVEDALRVIHESLDYICAERVAPNLAWMAQHLARHGEMGTTAELLEKLEQVSASTVGRMLDADGIAGFCVLISSSVGYCIVPWFVVHSPANPSPVERGGWHS